MAFRVRFLGGLLILRGFANNIKYYRYFWRDASVEGIYLWNFMI